MKEARHPSHPEECMLYDLLRLKLGKMQTDYCLSRDRKREQWKTECGKRKKLTNSHEETLRGHIFVYHDGSHDFLDVYRSQHLPKCIF